MRSDSSDSNINLNNIRGAKKNINHDDDYDSDIASNKKNNNLKNNFKSNSLQKTFTKEVKSSSSSRSRSRRSLSNERQNRSLSPVRHKKSPISMKKKTSYSSRSRSRSRSRSSDSRSTRRSKTRSRSVSRSPSPRSRNTYQVKSDFTDKIPKSTYKKPNNIYLVNNKTKKVISNSANNSLINSRKKYTGSNLSKNSSESYPANLNKHYINKKANGVSNGNNRDNSLPKTQTAETVLRLMSAQRLKNNDLKNRIAELSQEIEKLKDENKTLKRVHHREEIAIKRFESHDNDVSRLVKNHSDEVHSLRETIKTIKNDNRKLNSILIEKDEEIRSIRKRNEELKKILNDKKLFDSLELRKKLDQAEAQLSQYKTKTETLERKLEMLEKNHKHEIGVELAHHKETQKNFNKLNEEMKELKAKLEEKERALDMANIYSRVNKDTSREANNHPAWKASTQSLNSGMNETPREKRKQYDKKRREDIQKKTEMNNTESPKDDQKNKQKEEIDKKQLELQMQIKQQEADLKKKDAAERAKRLQREEEEERLRKQRELEMAAKAAAELERKRNIEEELRKKNEKQALEEEERKKRWISENTIKQLNQEENKYSKDISKKDELLAKLSLLDNEKNNNMAQNKDLSETIQSDFKTSKRNDSITALPPKPSNQQNQLMNSNDYKFSQTIENLHDGKPANSSREANKNELLNKLFGNTNNDNKNNVNDTFSFNQKQNMQSQSKLNKADDIFGSKPPNNSNIGINSNNQPYSSKVNLLPWEINDVNFNTTANQKPAAVSNFGSSNKNNGFNTYNSNTNNVESFFSLNLNENSNKKTNQIGNGTINRPKVENKLIFSSNHHKNNAFVEDIEELTL